MAYAVGVIVAATASTSEADREYRHHAYIIAQLQQQFQITTHHTAILRRVLLIYSQFIANKPTPFTQKKTTHTIPNIVCTRKKKHAKFILHNYTKPANKSDSYVWNEKKKQTRKQIICDLIAHCPIKRDTFLMHSDLIQMNA